MAKRHKNTIQESIDLCNKKTPSDTLFSSIGLLTGAVAATLLSLCLVVFLATNDAVYVTAIWYFIYYPSLALAIIGTFCCAGQMFRNKYISTVIGLLLNVVVVTTLITVSIVQGVAFGQVLAFPFFILPA